MKKRIVSGLLIGTFIITACTALGCGKNKNTEEDTTADNIQATTFDVVAEFSDRDLDFSYDEETAVKIALEGDSVSVTGEGAESSVKVSEGEITILKEGTYMVSGTLNDGTVIVDATDQKVQVVLDNAKIACDDFSAFYVENAEKVFLTLAEGSENTLTDGSEYSFANTDRGEADSVLFSKDDLTINGTGSLNVTGNYENGISGKDDLKIVSAYITVDAEKNGIKGKDSLLVKDGQISITAGNDGMKSDNDTETDKGFVYIESGIFNIVAEKDGIQAETGMEIRDGDFSITTGGGSANAETQSDREQVGYQGMWKEEGFSGESTETESESSESESDSAKGIKAGIELDILGGNFNIDSKDDALHSNSMLVIEKGTMEIATGDDGIHSELELQIHDGTINITKSYEGLESVVIRIEGGDIELVASDDGINAAGGALDNGQTEEQSQDGGAAIGGKNRMVGGNRGMGGMMESSTGYLYISGGNIVVKAEGDGLDANTDGEMSGGYVVVYGPSNGGNGSLDYGSTFEVTGGTLITAGSTGMAMAPSSGTTQNTVFATLSTSGQSGATVQITTASGEVLEEFTPTTAFASIIFSNSRLKIGEEYNIVVNGETYGTFTQSDTITYAGSSAGTGNMGGMQGGPGGAMNGGQMTPPSGTPGKMPSGENQESTDETL